MFDLGWTELLLIGVVALIVVGPKDLPVMFRTLGRFTGKARAMARDFQNAMNDAADEAGVKDVASDLKKATSSKNLGLDKLQEAATKFENWHPEDKDASESIHRGPETAKMTEERAEKARKIQEATAKRAEERLAREAEELKAAETTAADRVAETSEATPEDKT
ncbi:MAG: Sec-independent protein translocase protein TatB [Pseudoruegeria sp.]